MKQYISITASFKKFTPLFLAGLLCTSAPAHSTESWGSFALKGLGTWAACVCIGLGTTISHEYGHAVTGEVLQPANIVRIVIGGRDSQKFRDHPILEPVLFPQGLTTLHALGAFEGRVAWRNKLNPWHREVVISAAGPLAGATFASTILATTSSFLPKEEFWGKVIVGVLYGHILGNLLQLTASRNDSSSDGDKIQKSLGMHKALYNVLAFPVLCYAINKISKI